MGAKQPISSIFTVAHLHINICTGFWFYHDCYKMQDVPVWIVCKEVEGGVLLQANSTVSSQKYTTFEQCFLPFITPKFIHKDFTSCKCPESSVFWAYFHWVLDIVPSLKCLCKHIHTKFYSLVCWVLFFTLEKLAYAGSPPVITDCASCFNVSQLISTQPLLVFCSTHSAKLPFFHKATAVTTIVYLERIIAKNGGNGHMPETNRILEQTSPPHFCLKVVSKRGGEFRKLTIVRRCIYIYVYIYIHIIWRVKRQYGWIMQECVAVFSRMCDFLNSIVWGYLNCFRKKGFKESEKLW